ncbi:hypothetical protein Tsp_10460 [Trichinella spiralis]|uniref:hypothetical protein n=1 Tax=Trichinella spiralis TaxID=6334 RepID=UPI0001EFEE76|nr:hypothetical protein Tsp_10460 [Trichinella spiralis]
MKHAVSKHAALNQMTTWIVLWYISRNTQSRTVRIHSVLVNFSVKEWFSNWCVEQQSRSAQSSSSQYHLQFQTYRAYLSNDYPVVSDKWSYSRLAPFYRF